MKKLVTKCIFIIPAILLLLGIAVTANAQFTKVALETSRFYTALAKDGSNNIYVTRVKSGTGGVTYQVAKYAAGSVTSTVIYSGLTHETADYPWGLAVTSTGAIYVTTDFSALGGAILKLTPSGGAYTATTYQSGRYFSALAVDAADNLYAAEYDAVHKTYAVVKYPANSAANTAGTNLYDALKAGAGYSYPTGLAVAANGDIFVADAFGAIPHVHDGGSVIKLTAASAYAATVLSTGNYSSALALDLSGNLFSSENSGSGYHLTEYISGGVNTKIVFTPMHANGIYYPWGIAAISRDLMFAVDGDNGTNAGLLMKLTSANADLANLSTKAVMTPAFDPATTAYNASVIFTTSSATVTPTTNDPLETVQVNGTTVASGTSSPAIPLNVGPNDITTVVTAPDGITTKTYTVTVTRAPSGNADLIQLKVNAGAVPINPAFSGAVTGYTATVPNATTSVTITPTKHDANSTITVNGMAVTSGSPSYPIPLNVGPNAISTVVTAQDGVTTKTYTVTVTRAPSSNANLSHLQLSSGTLNPAFASGTTSYTAGVSNTTSSIMLTPTVSDPGATITVNGSAVASGTPSGAISLNVGSNAITTVVTAQDGTTTQSYTVTVTRSPSANADLSNLKVDNGAVVLSPSFSSGVTSYNASVPNATSSVRVLASLHGPSSTFTLNGVAGTSGVTSGPVPLSVGYTTINVVVTAQDGTTTKTYAISIYRASGAMNALYVPVGVAKPIETLQYAEDGITVHQGISPNGDGQNDVFTIDGITNYPDNKLSIMNRSGQLVYEAKGYDNTSKAFDGRSNKTGAKQLPGTYFYSLEYTVKGVAKHKTGFIILKW